MKKSLLFLAMLLGVVSTAHAFELGDNERLMGYYVTDDLPSSLEEYQAYLGFPDVSAELKAGVCFETQVTEKFIGGEITAVRFALADSTAVVSNVYICEMPTNYTFSTYDDYVVMEQDISDMSVKTGWNEVTLDNPVTINADKYYMIGYQYTQTTENYPLVTDYELETDYTATYGFFLYGKLISYYGIDWYYFNGYGQLCVQCVVSGGDFADNDIALTNLSVDKYGEANSALGYKVSVRNWGNLAAESYTLGIYLDNELVETLDTPVALTNAKSTITGTINLGSDLVSGNTYTVTFKVLTINGETPTESLDDDEISATFTAYEGSVERQKHIVEQFTSIYCGYCPRGHDVIETLQELYPEKYAWVAIHGSGMDSGSNTDPYVLDDEPTAYVEVFTGLYQSYPTAMFDRYIFENSTLNSTGYLGLSMGWASAYKEMVAEMINEELDAAYEAIPAFVSVDIDADVDWSTRTLTVTVSGEGANIASTLLSDAILTVYLTEDGLSGKQEDYDNGSAVKSYFISYTHDNVCRAMLSSSLGDDINWTSSSSYSNTYEVAMGNWELANMKVVAFISGPMVQYISGSAYWADKSNAYVNNANDFALTESNGIVLPQNLTPVNSDQIYNLAGQRVNVTAGKGLYIVNGKKVVK